MIYVLAAIFLITAACESKPKVSAQQMKQSLNQNVFAFNKALTGFQFDEAKTFAAPAADEKLKEIEAAMNRGEYNLLMTDEPPRIDYLKGEAQVPVRFLKGENAPAGQRPKAAEVKKQNHVWRFNNGSWQWYGDSSR
jgi:hypothetical protein